MDNMFGSFGEAFDFNHDGKLDGAEFGLMMEIMEEEEGWRSYPTGYSSRSNEDNED